MLVLAYQIKICVNILYQQKKEYVVVASCIQKKKERHFHGHMKKIVYSAVHLSIRFFVTSIDNVALACQKTSRIRGIFGH
jgi:hypothetical protein